MSRLTKYIESKMRRGDSKNISANSPSQYFTIYSRTIRVSNHPNINTSAELNIIVPFNNGKLYMVQMKNCDDVMVMNFQEVKALIDSSILMWSVNYKTSDASANYYKTKYHAVLKNNEQLNDSVKSIKTKYEKLLTKTLEEQDLKKNGQIPDGPYIDVSRLNHKQREGLNRHLKNIYNTSIKNKNTR